MILNFIAFSLGFIKPIPKASPVNPCDQGPTSEHSLADSSLPAVGSSSCNTGYHLVEHIVANIVTKLTQAGQTWCSTHKGNTLLTSKPCK